ncbi:MAG: (2Fe-2S)-binding protein [Oscillospiraceae bacterium]|nr:(2Fe-2S)-binding protein [Oscillospiraceae bacterium]
MANVKLTINGKAVSVPAGTSILDAAKEAGVRIPTLCAYEGMGPHASCKLCIVNIAGEEKEKLACAVKVAEGMVVTTDSPELFEKRKVTVTEMFRQHAVDCHHCARIGGSHIEDIDPELCRNCFYCDCVREGFCELQALAREFGVSVLPFEPRTHDFPVDESTGVIIRDGNKCVKCRRCVDMCKAQGMGILGMIKTENGTTVGAKNGMAADGCIRCGRCVDVCPTGALSMREHIDEIVYHAHEKHTTTAVMLCGCVMRELQSLYGTDFSYEQLAASVRKFGVDHVYSPGWARAESLRQAADLLDARLGKGLMIMTESAAAENFLRAKFPELEKHFAFYDSMQTVFGKRLRAEHPDWKLINISRHNGFAAEAADNGLVDYFVNARELFRIVERTGGAPYRREPGEVEDVAPYEKETRYDELLNRDGWLLTGEAEEFTFKKPNGRKLYKAAVCHNLAQAEKILARAEEFDIIRVMG